MKEALKEITHKEQFVKSLDRCSSDDQFFSAFYKRFIASSDDVQQKIRFTSLEKQNRMLLRSLKLPAGATESESAALAELKERVETHDRNHLDIKPELYDLWLESLVLTAQEFDRE